MGGRQPSLMTKPCDDTTSWILEMRKVARETIKAEDIREIVANQVKKAKAGDKAAMAFVFEQILAAPELRGMQMTQNNFYGVEERPDQPTAARPGTNGKLLAMQARMAAGQPLTRPDDGPPADLQ